MRKENYQNPYGPHVPQSLQRDGWWLDFNAAENHRWYNDLQECSRAAPKLVTGGQANDG